MAHPNEKMIRQAYQQFAEGNLDGYRSNCTENFAFNVPGTSQVAGSHRAKDGFYALIGRVVDLTAGNFREEVLDVLANDRHGVVLARHTLERDGKPHEYDTVHLYELEDGKLAEAWELPRDEQAFNAAWA